MADGSEQLATVKAYIAKYNLEVGGPRNRLTPVALSLSVIGGAYSHVHARSMLPLFSAQDELSNAVNQAIKLDSDDPYRVISDYLRQFANEKGDDEDEDDDDVIPEGEEPQLRSIGRRQVVAAKKLEVAADWTPPVYEKDEESQNFLKEVMATNKLMKSLAPSDREQLMLAFQVGSLPRLGTALPSLTPSTPSRPHPLSPLTLFCGSARVW